MAIEVVDTHRYTQHRALKPLSNDNTVRGSEMNTGTFGILESCVNSGNDHVGHLVYKASNSCLGCVNDSTYWSGGRGVTVHVLRPSEAITIVAK